MLFTLVFIGPQRPCVNIFSFLDIAAMQQCRENSDGANSVVDIPGLKPNWSSLICTIGPSIKYAKADAFLSTEIVPANGELFNNFMMYSVFGFHIIHRLINT